MKTLNIPAEFIYVTCPVCGSDVEVWTILQARCHVCGYKLFSREKTIH